MIATLVAAYLGIRWYSDMLSAPAPIAGRARSFCDGSKHLSFEDRLQLCFNPEGESTAVPPFNAP